MAHQAGAYLGFRSVKRLRVFLLPLGWDASPLQGYPPALSSPVPIYTPGWVGGAVASWLVRSTLERAVQVRALAGDLLRSWARHFSLTVPLSTQVYKWVPANLMLGGNR